MENWLLNMGLSWTLSKALPYILMILLGILLMWFVLKLLKRTKSKILKIIVAIIILLIPFGIYFATNPIYQGDFSNGGEVFTQKSELNPEKLTVIAMAGCPFCKQSIGLMSKIQERNPNIQIDFLVTSQNPDALIMYQKTATQFPLKINIALAKDPNNLAQIAKGSFPTFTAKTKDGWKTWSNNEFGVMALDEIEEIF